MIRIDGSFGEGGGAILRQAMALSTLTGKPFEIVNIRKGRPDSGLKAQHLHSISALEQLSDCQVTDCEVGSEKLTFIPGVVKNKSADVNVGTAGSVTLLLQSLLLPCIFSGKSVTVNLVGGTDVKWSQPIDYFANVVVPFFRPYADIEVKTMLRGYYPKGGGRVIVKIKSKMTLDADLGPVVLTRRGELLQIRGVSHASADLESSMVADRQASAAQVLLSDYKVIVNIIRHYSKTFSIGSGIVLWALFKDDLRERPLIIGSDCLGERGLKAELVGESAAMNLREELKYGCVIDKYLADQIVPLLAITKGSVKTSKITGHTRSNIYVAEKFFDVKFTIKDNVISV